MFPSEIFKINIEWWTNELYEFFKNVNFNKQHESWQNGQILFIHKSGDRKHLDNYRPITLLPTIYKLWETIMSNIITPILNIITNDQQCAYRANKYTMEIIYNIKKKPIKRCNTRTNFT